MYCIIGCRNKHLQNILIPNNFFQHLNKDHCRTISYAVAAKEVINTDIIY